MIQGARSQEPEVSSLHTSPHLPSVSPILLLLPYYAVLRICRCSRTITTNGSLRARRIDPAEHVARVYQPPCTLLSRASTLFADD